MIPAPASQRTEPETLPPQVIPSQPPATPIVALSVRSATPIIVGNRQPSMGPPRVIPTTPLAPPPIVHYPSPAPPLPPPIFHAASQPQLESVQAPVAPSPPLPTPDPSNPTLQFDTSPFPPPIHQPNLSHAHELGDIQGSEAQRLRLNSESVVKPVRPSRRKMPTTEAAEDVELSERRSRKRTRSKKAAATSETDGQAEEGQNEGAEKAPRKRARVRKTRATEDGAEDESGQPKKRRRKSATPREPKELAPAFTADAEPGEDLDPTVITMANLCEDTGQGRVSSKAAHIFDNHAAWKQANKERRARMRAIVEAKKYGRDEEDVDGGKQVAASSSQPAPTEVSGPSKPSTPEGFQPVGEDAGEGDDGGKDDGDGNFDYSQTINTSRYNVRVRIGPNGETIVDEESLFVDRTEEDETENYVHVEESDATKFVNSGSYGKKPGGSRWSGMETELFYEVRTSYTYPSLPGSNVQVTGTFTVRRELRADFLCHAWSRP